MNHTDDNEFQFMAREQKSRIQGMLSKHPDARSRWLKPPVGEERSKHHDAVVRFGLLQNAAVERWGALVELAFAMEKEESGDGLDA